MIEKKKYEKKILSDLQDKYHSKSMDWIDEVKIKDLQDKEKDRVKTEIKVYEIIDSYDHYLDIDFDSSETNILLEYSEELPDDQFKLIIEIPSENQDFLDNEKEKRIFKNRLKHKLKKIFIEGRIEKIEIEQSDDKG